MFTGIVIFGPFVKNHEKRRLLSVLRFLFEPDISEKELVMDGEENWAFGKDLEICAEV